MNAREQLQDKLRALAMLIGLRAAARKLGVKEQTAGIWAHRGNWQLSKIDGFAPLRVDPRRAKSHENTIYASIEQSLRETSEDTRLYLSAAALKAGIAAAGMEGTEILGK